MTKSARANVASSYTTIRGAMIEETYAAFAQWDDCQTKRENIDRILAENPVGAKSATWLQHVAKVLNRRFDPEGRDRALIFLARSGCDVEVWKPILLWHITRDEFLLRDFLQNWLFSQHEDGALRVRREDVEKYLETIHERGAVQEHEWQDSTTNRVAAGLLKMGTDFGLLTGAVHKEFATYHIPEKSFIYLLHAIFEEQGGPAKLVGAKDWRMYLMHPSDVEHELLRLHQFRKLEYEVAGSLTQLSLPCNSSYEYAERMMA